MTHFKEDRDLADLVLACARMDSEYDPVDDIAEYRRKIIKDFMDDLEGE